LGIFVSGSVAKKEHDEFASNIDLIDVLPPGLYEAVLRPKGPTDTRSDLVEGDYLVRFEARTLDDIRAFGGNDEADERKFATAARVSEINLNLYRTFVQPWVQLWSSEETAEWMRRMHPLRTQYEMFSGTNPVVGAMLSSLEAVQAGRRPVPQDNIFWQAQEMFSNWVETSLDTYRGLRDRGIETWFHATYGSPLLQALVGINPSERARQRPVTSAAHKALVEQRIAELKANLAEGGPREAIIRALLYVRMPEAAADERGFNLLTRLRGETGRGLSLEAFKRIVREQYFTLILEEQRAVEAIPALLARDPKLAARMAGILREIIAAVGVSNPVSKARLAEVEAMFDRSGMPGDQDQVEMLAAKPPRGTHPKSQVERSSKH